MALDLLERLKQRLVVLSRGRAVQQATTRPIRITAERDGEFSSVHGGGGLGVATSSVRHTTAIDVARINVDR